MRSIVLANKERNVMGESSVQVQKTGIFDTYNQKISKKTEREL